MQVGDEVVYDGHDEYGNEYRIGIVYHYAALFGNKTYVVKDIRRDCCNVYLILSGVCGAFNAKLFRQKIPPVPHNP